jgi:hypothetical protein
MRVTTDVEVLQSAKSPKDQIHTRMNRIYRRKTIRRHHTGQNGEGRGETLAVGSGAGQGRSCKREEQGKVYCTTTHQRRKDGSDEEAEENPGDEEANDANSMAA